MLLSTQLFSPDQKISHSPPTVLFNSNKDINLTNWLVQSPSPDLAPGSDCCCRDTDTILRSSQRCCNPLALNMDLLEILVNNLFCDNFVTRAHFGQSIQDNSQVVSLTHSGVFPQLVLMVIVSKIKIPGMEAKSEHKPFSWFSWWKIWFHYPPLITFQMNCNVAWYKNWF